MFFCAGLSDTGPVKPVNQDAYLLKRAQTAAGDIALLVVADGMSGLQQGEVAAGAVVHAFDAWFQRDLPLAGESLGFTGQAFSNTVQVQWSNLLQEVNLSLLKSSARQGVSCGAACTIFMAAAGFYYAMQVGDTRLYCVREDELVQLTHDQTFAARELEQGRMTRREAQEHPLRNALLQCVGASRNLSPVFLSGALENEATYVVCSDGFYKSLANAELAFALSAPELRAYAADPAAAHLKAYLQKILNVVYARGQRDNATVAVVFPVTPSAAASDAVAASAAAAAATASAATRTASPFPEKGGSNA